VIDFANTAPHLRVGTATPWGAAQSVHVVECEGLAIVKVSTASHGGIYVPGALLARIPEVAQLYAQSWSGSRHWYEEDCAWAFVALSLPEFFSAREIEAAIATIEWLDELLHRPKALPQ
jgi:hypothetical protein